MKEFFEKISRFVNLNELIFDLTITISAIVVYRFIVPKNALFFLDISLNLKIAVIVLVQFLIASYFVNLLLPYLEKMNAEVIPIPEKGFFDRLNARFLNSNVYYFIIVVLIGVAITGLYALMPGIIDDQLRNIEINVPEGSPDKYLGGFVLLLMGIAVSLPGILTFMGGKSFHVWFWIAFVPIMYSLIRGLIPSIQYFSALYGVIGGCLFGLSLVGIVIAIIRLKKHFNEKPVRLNTPMKKAVGVFRSLIIPFLTAIALIIWTEMSLISSVQELVNNNIPITMLNIFPYLLLSGIIPIRIVILLVPPIKPVNIIISVVTLYFLYFNIDSVLGSLSQVIHG